MKTTKMLTILVLAMGLMAWPAKVSEAAPLGTAFMYQGLLIDGTEVLDGSYDLMVSLFDDPNEGELRGTVFVDDLDVNDGWFEIMLDFGDGVFDGSARWLETAVRPGELEDPNEYVILLPRQDVTPTPYALYAKTAGAAQTLRAADGSPTAAVYVHSDGNVGIGTISPSEKLDVEGNIHASGLLTSGGSIAIDGTNDRITATSGTIDFDNENLVTTGSVGIGTTSPESKLHVSGSSSDAIVSATNTGTGYSVYGLHVDSGNHGVLGASGGGVFGRSDASFAVRGYTVSGVGVLGYNASSGTEGELGTSDYGVRGYQSGSGTWGYLGGFSGAYGEHDATGNFGCLGKETSGVYGWSDSGNGVRGITRTGVGRDGAAVYGYHENSGNYGVLGGNDYGVKSEGDLVVEGSDAAYRGTIGPNNGAPFPRPAYDSGWFYEAPNDPAVLSHNIGGNVNDYVVTVQIIGTRGISGIDASVYYNLTTNSIGVYAGGGRQVRVRIWVYN